jgi:Ca2+-binding RTX toxin-like protein
MSMTTHRLNKASDSTWEITDGGDTWILGEKGSIAGTDMNGIHAADTIGKATVRIDGEIALGGLSTAVYLEAKRGVATITDTGSLSATNGVYYDNNEGTTLIRNEGLVEASLGLFAVTKQGGASIVNTGRIVADEGIETDSAGARIVNSGVITAAYDGILVDSQPEDTDTHLAKNATYILNTGRITGSDYSVTSYDVAVNLRNKGTLNGDVVLDAGEDVVNNRGGTINGDVQLWNGDDHFDGRGGKLNGVVYGGDGDDIVTLASPATLYVENANEGLDQVRINATYRLGANIETLVLLGKANHTGIGNGMGNTIAGNKGDNALYGLDGGDTLYGHEGRDTLTGGLGGDYFCFMLHDGRDTIMDFQDGTDNIYFNGFDGITDFADLDGKISQSGDDVVIAFNDHDHLIIRDIALNQITELDFAFL